jgi:peptide deformylase
MAMRRILIYGDPILHQRAAPVREVDEGVRALVQDLFDTLGGARGIGLAAPQIGVLRRVIVVDPRPVERPGVRALALIDPEILGYEGSCVFEEGCLSLPGTYADVRRPERVTVRYLDREGREQIEEFESIMARVVQHEIDHLDGVLFIDRLPRMRRTLAQRKLRGTTAETPAGRTAP